MSRRDDRLCVRAGALMRASDFGDCRDARHLLGGLGRWRYNGRAEKRGSEPPIPISRLQTARSVRLMGRTLGLAAVQINVVREYMLATARNRGPSPADVCLPADVHAPECWRFDRDAALHEIGAVTRRRRVSECADDRSALRRCHLTCPQQRAQAPRIRSRVLLERGVHTARYAAPPGMMFYAQDFWYSAVKIDSRLYR